MSISSVHSQERGNGAPTNHHSISGTVAIDTHGCKLNQADSATLARQFLNAGYRTVDDHSDADIIIINTCTVTADADAKARQALRAARRDNPNAIVVAAGCYPQRAADEIRRMPEVSLVVGNAEKPELAELAIARLATERTGGVQPHPQRPWPSMDGRGILRRSRVMVKIQEGCDQVCAYCIVPKVRGRERSIPTGQLVATVREHVAAGFKEVALTGTQLGTYGFDLDGENLARLLATLLEKTTVPRLRVSSLQAHEIGPGLLELWRDRRLCPHFHVPLQSGCNATLASMRRRYDTGAFRRAVDLIREAVPDASVTTDVIVGFPGEDERAHASSLAFAATVGFADMHVFRYSQRPGTTAAHLPHQVSPDEKRRRAAEMLAVAERGFIDYRNGMVGQRRSTLWETARAVGWPEVQDPSHDAASGGNSQPALSWSGLTDNYVRVTAISARDLRNHITDAQLVKLDGKSVVATIPDYSSTGRR